MELVRIDPERLYDFLTEKFNGLEKKIEEQTQIIIKQDIRIKELEARLNQNSSNSSKPPSSDMFKKNLDESRKSSRRKSGGQVGHKGSNLKMVAKPDKIELYESPKNCLNCGKSLEEINSKITRGQEFNIPEIKILVTEHRVEKKKCSCGHCNVAPNAPEIKNNTFYGNNFRALVLYLKNQQMLPFHRTKQIIKDLLNHDISEGTFWNIEKDFSENVKSTEEQIKQAITRSKTVGADETGTRAEGRNFWIHTAVTNLFSHFSANIKRGMIGIKAGGILENIKGTLVHDFFKPYLTLLCKHSFCNAHILRELIAVYENTSQVWADQMIEILITALNTKKNLSPIAPNQVVIQEILLLYDKVIQLGYQENPPIIDGKKVKKSKPLNLLKRLDTHRNDIMKFLSNPEIPFDNNFSERSLRMIKVKNKISGCFRSKEGIEYFCRARSFIDTCRKQKFNIFKSIVMIFNGETIQFATE